jgi:hypothetical protein
MQRYCKDFTYVSNSSPKPVYKDCWYYKNSSVTDVILTAYELHRRGHMRSQRQGTVRNNWNVAGYCI